MIGGRTTHYHPLSCLLTGLLIILSALLGTGILSDQSGNHANTGMFQMGLTDPTSTVLGAATPTKTLNEAVHGSFRKNQGQLANTEILYYCEAGDLDIGFVNGGYLISIDTGSDAGTSIVRITYPGSNGWAIPIGEGLKGSKTSQFIGNDPDAWVTGIWEFRTILYDDVYPGIDLVFTIVQGTLKYDWVLKPGADPKDIRESYSGIDSLSLGENGGLVIHTASGDVQLDVPFSYQTGDGGEVLEIPSNYQIDENGRTVAYHIGEYDPSLELVIDPLIGGTFFGTVDGDAAYSVTTDDDDNIYLIGTAATTNFPTTPESYSHISGNNEIFVTKFDPLLKRIIYSVLIGGFHNDMAKCIVVDDEGCAYVASTTWSHDFPTTNGSYMDNSSGTTGGILFKLNADGSDLVFSTFIGGGYSASFTDLVLDEEKNIYLTGTMGNIVVLKFKADGSGIIANMTVGGEMMDASNAMAQDGNGDLYITGYSQSPDFPVTPGCFQSIKGGLQYINGQANDVFVMKVNGNLTRLIYSTFLGGNNGDNAADIEVDDSGCAIITGTTSSDNFPTTPGAYNRTYGVRADMFVTKFNPNGTDLVYSTYVPSPDEELEMGMGLDLDSSGNACVLGMTYSHNFPTTPGCFLPSWPGGGRHDLGSAFVIILDPEGSLLYSTYASGGGEDFPEDIVVDSQDNIIVAGWVRLEPTHIPHLPGNFDINGHMNDGFIVKFNSTSDPIPRITLDPSDAYLDTEPIRLTGQVQSDSFVIQHIWIVDDVEVYNGTNQNYLLPPQSAGTHTVRFGAINEAGYWKETSDQELIVHSRPIAIIQPPSSTVFRNTDSISLMGYGTDDGTIEQYSWRIGTTFSNGTDPELFHSPLPPGIHTIGFRVRDNYYVWSHETSIDINVISWPEAIIIPFDDDVFASDENITFRCSSRDGRTVTMVNWTSSLDGILCQGSQSTTDLTGLSTGLHVISLQIRDAWGFWSNATSVLLNITSRPAGSISTISPSPALITDLVDFKGSAVDDLGVAFYSWASDIDGILWEGSDPNFSTTGLSLGTHSISLTARDDQGFWSYPVNTELIVTELPQAFIDSHSPNPMASDESLSLSGHGLDDGLVSLFVWSSDLDGELISTDNGSALITGLSPGMHTISLRTRDNLGFWSVPASIFLVVHERPTAIISDISPSPTTVGSLITFSGSGTDDGIVSSFSWSSDRDGNLSSQAEFQMSTLSRGVHTISFKVMDDFGCWSRPADRILVIMSRPITVITNISHTAALVGEEVFLSGYAIDDGAIIEVQWRSSIDGAFGSERTKSTSDLSAGSHEIMFRAMDEHGLWSDGAIEHLVVHTPPAARIISIQPEIPSSEEPMTLIGEGSDDGEVVRYHWSSSIDGELFNGTWEEAHVGSLSLGIHTISLRVQDDHGVWSEEAQMEIQVTERDEDQSDDSAALIIAALLVIIGFAGIIAIVIKLPESTFKK